MDGHGLRAAPRPSVGAPAEVPAIAGAARWAPLIGGWIALAAYGVHLATGFAGDTLATILYLAAVAGGAGGATVAARARPGRPSTMFAFAIAGYGFASVYYVLVPDAASRFPSALDIPLFAFYPLVFLAFAGFVRRQNAELSGALALDAVLGALIVSALGATALSPLVDPAASVRVTGQMVYVLADLSFFGFLIATYTLSGLREGATLMVLATGAVLLAVGDGSYFIDVASGSHAPDAVSVLAWPAAMLVLVLAPYLGQRRAAPRSSTWARIGIPCAAAVTGAPVEILSTGLSPQRLLAAAALILVVVRLMVSLHQNSRLLASAHVAATTDRLTGLANREALSDRLERALALRAEGGDVAVMFLDLDEFKAINDTHGHDIGDQVLISVAERLCRALRSGDTAAGPRDTVGRLGGDEFVVLLEGLGDPGAAVLVADRILDEIRASLVIGELTIFLDTSIGITTSCAHDDRGPAELLRDADTAMYEAKRGGRHRHELFEPAMRERVVARAEMIQALRTAVACGELRVLYQPQVDLGSGRMTAVEALVRWEHPQQGLLVPDRFIPLAESAGLIADIDDWVLREACAQLRRWDDAGMPALDMAVNVSSRRLGGDLAGTVAEVLRVTGIDATRLEVEITETVAVEQDSAGVAAIAGVRELGVSVAMDDFGIGHSALSR
ncbi:MAG: hypothetical protein QOD73_3244, partial [Solirubrobacteraceae bacterium]|nr:hypothetical protein [Solirubrobacteraceae bacterium]